MELSVMEEIIKQLEPGDLVAFFYRNRTEQLAFTIPFLKEGLLRNERCLYIADDTPVGLIFKKLEESGLDVADAQKRGALEVLTKHETYLRGGQFEADRMIDDLESSISDALASGFSGFRGSGDMNWALDSRARLENMCDYQRKLHSRFPVNFVAACQYDETRFTKEVLEEIVKNHHMLIRDGKLFRLSEPAYADQSPSEKLVHSGKS